MAITPVHLRLIRKVGGKGRAASAGYPDLLIPESLAFQFLGEKLNDVPVREDSQKIAQWHGVNFPNIYESKAFLKAMDYDMDVFDIKEIRGGEIVVDLNYQLHYSFAEQYDLVIDSGTCEHCFHIGQAAMNLAGLLKEGGHIIQGLPLNAYNHGFYSVSPTWVRDFYGDNGFEVKECFGLQNGTYKTFPLKSTERVQGLPENSFMIVMAQRTKVQPLTVPTQWKYR
jgi:hypothetical protein